MSLKGKKKLGPLVTTAALLLTASLLAACSSTPKTSNTTSGGSTSGTLADGGTAVPAAVTALKALEVRPTQIQITTPVGKPIPTGKTIDWLVCGSPLCTILTQSLDAAAAQLGWKVVAIPAGLTPETVLDAWNLAVQNHPDAVMASAFPEVIFSAPLAQLKADNIPVIDGFVTDHDGNGITATVVSQPSEYAGTGKAQAIAAVADGGTKTNTLFVYGSTFPADVDVESGFQPEQEQLCPTCTFAALNVPETAVGTQLPADVVAYINRHPGVNTVALGEGSFITGLPQALASAGLSKVNVVGQYPTTSEMQYVANNQVTQVSMTEQGDAMWVYVDALARYFAGVPVAPSEASSPVWMIDKANATQLSGPAYTEVQGYQAEFEKLWGK